MTVGLFAAIGIVAWLPLIPALVWPAATAARAGTVVTLGKAATWACGLAAASRLLPRSFTASRRGATEPLPRPLAAAINLTCLPQQWAMFGGVPARNSGSTAAGCWPMAHSWTCSATVGRLEPERPAGGFASLLHHRWHKFSLDPAAATRERIRGPGSCGPGSGLECSPWPRATGRFARDPLRAPRARGDRRHAERCVDRILAAAITHRLGQSGPVSPSRSAGSGWS